MTDRRELARARARLQASLRGSFAVLGYEEVETPALVPAPGMEPHIDAFLAPFLPEGGGPARPLWLHTSPEYAMKRLLGEGFTRIFQLARVFRNGEVSATHNPEFTLLELYEAGSDGAGIMARVERLVAEAARAVAGTTTVEANGRTLDLAPPFERLTVAEAFRSRLGVEVLDCGGDVEALRASLLAGGHGGGRPGDSFDDLFFRAFLEQVEPTIGLDRPTYVTGWPASMAALAALLPEDPRAADRFELYAGGLELANGWTELTDAVEQRRRLEAERALRVALGRPAYPIDEAFLAALPQLPPCGGVAVGLDRLLMLFTGARTIDEVLLFPASGFAGW